MVIQKKLYLQTHACVELTATHLAQALLLTPKHYAHWQAGQPFMAIESALLPGMRVRLCAGAAGFWHLIIQHSSPQAQCTIKIKTPKTK